LLLFGPVARAQNAPAAPPPAAPATAPDASGKWTAALETPIGVFKYTYTLKVEGAKVTGTAGFEAMADFPASQVAITEGKASAKTLSFREVLSIMGMDINIDYTGELVSADEIKFTRQVGEFATEEFVAKRAKN
jgi:hypothetical protein